MQVTGDDNEASQTRSDAWVIRVFDDPSEIDAAEWDGLLAAQPSATPFMQHAYLLALHTSASANAETGWLPQFLALFDPRQPNGRQIVAACPLYLKDH